MQAVQQHAMDLKLDESEIWAALLHYRSGRSGITDNRFILSHGLFSLRNELMATIAYLYADESNVCRFPARYIWLKNELALPDLPIERCKDLTEFKERAPIEKIALVFASENLSQPSSMMGHLFIKVSGDNKQGIRMEHAISFFTDTATINVPKLFYDSLVAGKKGYFALSPYTEDVDNYVGKEKRNLWEYDLRLTAFQRSLIQHHLFELKSTEFTYFFQSYNCATLVKHILALAYPQILEKSELWTTPKDVIKHADNAGLIENSTVRSPSRWMIRILGETIEADEAKILKEEVAHQSGSVLLAPNGGIRGFLKLELATAYNNFLFEQKNISKSDWQFLSRKLEKTKNEFYQGYQIEATQSKNPLHAPQDSQLAIGWEGQAGQHYLKFDFLPVSHRIEDDNRLYFSENELKLFEISLRAQTDGRKIQLDHLTIYSVQSLLPNEIFTGGISGKFKLGVEPQFDHALNRKTALLAEGGLGATFRPAKDMDFFAMMGMGMGYAGKPYIYTIPSLGLLVREVYDMKSILSLSHHHHELASRGEFFEINAVQSKYLTKDLSLIAQAKRQLNKTHQHTTVSLQLKKIF